MALSPLRWQRLIARNNQRALLKLIQSTDGQMLDAVAQASRNAEKILRGMPSGSISAKVRQAYIAQHAQALNNLAQDFWSEAELNAVGGIGTASQLAVNANRQMLSFLTRAVGPGSSGLLADSMLHSAANTFADLRSRFLNNIKLSDTVFKNAALMGGKIDAIINQGILLGQSAKEIADGVVGHINPKVLGGQRYAAMRLARTELNNAYHTTSVLSYQDSPYVEGVLWQLSGSHPKSDDCDAFAHDDSYELGEGVFPAKSVPDKPHPNCFCYLVPVTPDIDEFVRKMRNGDYDCG